MSDENEDNELVECDECSQQLGQDDILTTSEGNTVCDDCIRMCEHCEWSGTSDDSWHTVSDELWCEGCWENESVYCDRCDYTYNGDRVATNHINGVDERWCEYCYSDHAVYCEDCDEYYADDDGSCPSCNNSSRTIHQYSYKPNPVFHGGNDNNLYMGFELEMSFGDNPDRGDYNTAISDVLELEQANVCYLKQDGSIEGWGYELVSHPHTLGAYDLHANEKVVVPAKGHAIVDTYGGMARHGGGAFSGKDPSKVDRSAAYAMRWVAKNVVAAGLAERCEVQVAYAIGKAHPVGLFVETFGTEKVSNLKISEAINNVFDLRPAAIIRDLDLLRPIYSKTAAYGHFGRELPDFTWEKTDRASALKSYFN